MPRTAALGRRSSSLLMLPTPMLRQAQKDMLLHGQRVTRFFGCIGFSIFACHNTTLRHYTKDFDGYQDTVTRRAPSAPETGTGNTGAFYQGLQFGPDHIRGHLPGTDICPKATIDT